MTQPIRYHIQKLGKLTADGEPAVNVFCALCGQLICENVSETHWLNAAGLFVSHYADEHPGL